LNITLQGVSARHPAARVGHAPALRSLDLSIAPGEQVAVIGPSGAGKTTLLQVMACALPPVSGTLQLDGRDPWALSRAALQRQRGQLFLAPQVPPLPPRQRVVTSVLAARLPAMGLLSSLRSLLADKLFERVDRLSGGERQRVGLARALLAPARVWLIDEPLSALDPTRSKQAVATLLEGARERGATLIATLHQVDVALTHFPRIVGLRDGQLAFDLPAAEVTQERLARLYNQFEHELRGEVPVVTVEPTAPQPAVMHCR